MNSSNPGGSPAPQVRRLRQGIQDLMEDLWEELDQVSDPAAKALLETTAEVLSGLQNEFQRYEQSVEEARRG